MPSVFTLFGELKLGGSEAFERSIKSADTKLEDLRTELSKTEVASLRLGDTSASVARKYEKLNEAITANKTRALEAATAYQKGDITLKKYATEIAAVDKATASLNSRLKDAAARVTELNQTGLTPFQNQIKGAVSAANPSNDLLKSLSGFQKTQLSFQLNDILTGLASGQDPLRILAQQGGQVFQIFQQGKQEAQGIALATEAAATAQTKLATASQATAIAQAETAVASRATATAVAEGNATMTLFGASVVGLGALLATGLVTILAAKKASEDILKTATDRLKAEEAVVGALNKQYLEAKRLKEELGDIAQKGQFDRTLKSFSDGSVGVAQLTRYQAQLQAQFDANLKSVTSEINRRADEADQRGLRGAGKTNYVGGATPEGFAKTQKELYDQITAVASRIEDLRTSEPSGMDWYTQIQKQQREALKTNQSEVLKAEKELAAERKRLIDDSIRQAKEFAAYVKDLRTENLKRFDKTLQALELRKDAKEFEKGKLAPAQSVSARVREQLAALGIRTQYTPADIPANLKGLTASELLAKGFQDVTTDQAGRIISAAKLGFTGPKGLDDKLQSALDQAVIKATQGLDPAGLSKQINAQAAAARRREADRIERDRDEINKKLLKALENPTSLDVLVTDQVGVGIGTSGNVNARYLRR